MPTFISGGRPVKRRTAPPLPGSGHLPSPSHTVNGKKQTNYYKATNKEAQITLCYSIHYTNGCKFHGTRYCSYAEANGANYHYYYTTKPQPLDQFSSKTHQCFETVASQAERG